MNDPEPPTLRQRQAQETRQAILEAARTLFAARGYVETSIAEIAAEAGVAVQTVYKVMGSKATIIASLIELISQGDGGAERQQALADATTAPEILHAGVVLMTELNARFGDIIRAINSAAASSPDAAAALEQGERMHRFGTAGAAARIGELGALRKGLTVDDAARIFNLMTSSAAFRELTEAYGLSHAEAGDWLEQQLVALLLR